MPQIASVSRNAAHDRLRERFCSTDLWDNLPVGVCCCDTEGYLLGFNRRAIELWGRRPEVQRERYGGATRLFTEAGVLLPKEQGPLAEALRTGKSISNQLVVKEDARGRRTVVLYNAEPVRDESGVLLGAVGCFQEAAAPQRLFSASVFADQQNHEKDLRSFSVLQTMPVAIYATDTAGRITFANAACEKFAGGELRVGSDLARAGWQFYSLEGELLRHDEWPVAITLKNGHAPPPVELLLERSDGRRFRVLPHPVPMFDGVGRLTGALNMLVDVTAVHEVDVQLARLSAIVASSDDAIISKSRDGVITSWNAAASRIYGYEDHEVIGKPITIIIPPELHQEELDILAKIRRGDRVDHYETVRITKDGRRIDVSLTVSPILDRLGRVVGASKVSRDITERKRNEQIQRLLVRELNHRVKNTLATVQAIATQTIRSAKSPNEFLGNFQGRLQALARVHEMLTNTSWQGAAIEDLIREQLLFDSDADERINLNGPNVVLNPQAALHLALILHELGTNARKYGALSVSQGTLELRWTVRDHAGVLLLDWKESGGPLVRPPERRGFGSPLIERSLDAQAGKVLLNFEPEGVTCEIVLPLEVEGHGVEEDRSSFASRKDGTSSAGSAKARVLVVEDEPLVAMDIAMVLSEAGCEVIGPAASLDEARSLIAAGAVDAALLDANLGGYPVDDLAAELKHNSTPFAFLTGYGREGMPPEFRDAPLIEKPFMPEQLLQAVRQLIGQRAMA